MYDGQVAEGGELPEARAPTREEMFDRYADLLLACAMAEDLEAKLTEMGLHEERMDVLAVKNSLSFTRSTLADAIIPPEDEDER